MEIEHITSQNNGPAVRPLRKIRSEMEAVDHQITRRVAVRVLNRLMDEAIKLPVRLKVKTITLRCTTGNSGELLVDGSAQVTTSLYATASELDERM